MKLDPSLLHLECIPCEFTRPMDNLRLAQNLFQLMMKSDGIGLAANQAGVNARLFVMYVDREAFHCFNPEILEHRGATITSREGCLSYPGDVCEISRSATILVKFANARGIYQEREFTGLAARCFQHELDHLNGITMHDRVTEGV
jgi:peptide deformylase